MPSKLSPIGVEHGKMELRTIVNESCQHLLSQERVGRGRDRHTGRMCRATVDGD